VFLDIDLHLLAPRLSAAEETMALFVRAARLVGARSTGAPWARLQVQTRVPDHPLLAAISRGEPAAVLAEEVAIRRASALPPFAALALVSGVLAPAYAESLRREADAPTAPTAPTGPTGPNGPAPTTTSVSPLGDDRFLLRADTHEPCATSP
jgi:primosomal protein N' (replication factor Y)